MNMLLRPARSSLGSKYVVALTGLALIGFVIMHMAGNLLLFAGPDAINSYAANLQDHPALLWPARFVLLVVFVVHIALAIRLTRQNAQARPIPYKYPDQTLQASWASRHMFLSGMFLLAFVLYHLAHFTLGVVVPARETTPAGGFEYRSYASLAQARRAPDGHWYFAPELDATKPPPPGYEVRHDVYRMVVSGFQNWWITTTYLIAMAFLGLHLWHGGSSWFQSLGLESKRYNGIIRTVGPVLAVLLVAGNCSIVLSVFLGLVK